MIRTHTGAQRYNARMHRIFEEAKKLKAKYAPLHAVQLLTRLTEKVESVNAIQHSGGRVTAEDWSELYAITNESRAVLENVDQAKLVLDIEQKV
jgi:hypothetical protein